ncbi:MAG: hypothetical protein B7Z66_08880 [Chromatiales bacterium 21-64-14]|nr:MAG: hypothetical protein B7Z66_08880 [Chromatiales bacterium 21-64-14]HQU16104.1 hypothetical protein [Gammaproteobacteria bacterium]
MQPAISDHLVRLLVVGILISRIGDIGTTYLASPGLKLEANPIVRKFRWWYAFLTLFVCVIPYWNAGAGIMVMVVSFLVSTSNSMRLWFIRALGETEYFHLQVRVASAANPVSSLMLILLPPVFMALLGISLWVVYPDPAIDPGYWFASGILVYGAVLAVYSPLHFLRLRREARISGVG